MDEKTIDYYNNNAERFVSGTVSVTFDSIQNRFLKKLPEQAKILDFGCGSGRDTKYFLENGLLVDAIDGSTELCRIASELTGIPVRQMYFQELKDVEKYDGIWACSSILHLKKDELPDVLEKMKIALKKHGIIYTSFKYGDFEGERDGRYFTYLTEESFQKLLVKVSGLAIEEQWVAADVRPGRGDERWLNLIIRKMEKSIE